MNGKPWKQQLSAELFSGTAESLAKEINRERTQKLNNPTQLRKFYDEVLRYRSMVQANPDDFSGLLPYIKMLNAKAAYAEGRDLISGKFRQFLSKSLQSVTDQEDFDIFCTFFESFMGFYKYYSEKEKNGGTPHQQPPHQGQRREYIPNNRR